MPRWTSLLASNADKYLIRQGLTDAVMGQMSARHINEVASWHGDYVGSATLDEEQRGAAV